MQDDMEETEYELETVEIDGDQLHSILWQHATEAAHTQQTAGGTPGWDPLCHRPHVTQEPR
jgi:hypothetical protein